MPLNLSYLAPSITRAIVLALEIALHAATIIYIAAATHGWEMGAFVSMQLSIDVIVILTTVVFVLLTREPLLAGPSRIRNVIGFSIILLFSLAGAVGLAIRSASGKGLCGDAASAVSGRCTVIWPIIATSWISAVAAMVGTLASWFDKVLTAPDAEKLFDPHPRVHISEPMASDAASQPWGTRRTQGPIQPAPTQTLPRHSQWVPLNRVTPPSS